MNAMPLAALAMLVGSAPVRADTVPFDDGRWTISAREHRFEDYLGRPSLYLDNGAAVLEDSSFRNGVIEYDVAVPRQRGFIACMWRMQDAGDYEEFYIRPHQSGNPDATQYTPAFGGVTAWQLYHGPGYGEPVTFRHDQWMHVKIVVAGDRAEVYLDSEEPVQVIGDLKRDDTPGMVGLNAFTCPAHFANFSFRTIDAPELKGAPPPAPKPLKHAVARWSVSSGFAEAELRNVLELPPAFTDSLSWSTLRAEPTGITNLARACDRSPATDTVIARVILHAEEDGLATMRFGYSDRVRVYADGRLIYAGDNGYRSRDYRYLGTIGLFDAVCIPLKRGDNEICCAVSESFGGWGIMASIDPGDNLTITP